MTTKALHEIFTAKAGISPIARHSMSDMAGHFNALRQYGHDCSIVHELGVREIGSSWAFLMGLADRGNAMVTVSEDRRKLEMNPITALISIDHVHPDKFAGEGTLAEFQKHALENNVHHEFIESSSLDITIDHSHCIFFDTDHTYKQLSQELQLHGNKSLKYLLFHDTVGCAHEIIDRKSTRLNSSHGYISYAVFCLKKKKKQNKTKTKKKTQKNKKTNL